MSATKPTAMHWKHGNFGVRTAVSEDLVLVYGIIDSTGVFGIRQRAGGWFLSHLPSGSSLNKVGFNTQTKAMAFAELVRQITDWSLVTDYSSAETPGLKARVVQAETDIHAKKV